MSLRPDKRGQTSVRPSIVRLGRVRHRIDHDRCQPCKARACLQRLSKATNGASDHPGLNAQHRNKSNCIEWVSFPHDALLAQPRCQSDAHPKAHPPTAPAEPQRRPLHLDLSTLSSPTTSNQQTMWALTQPVITASAAPVLRGHVGRLLVMLTHPDPDVVRGAPRQ